MLRFEVPVDDAVHDVACGINPVVHVASREHGVVEFWAEVDVAVPSTRRFVAVATGHPLPTRARYVGTTLAAHGLVWHLYEVIS